MKEKTENKDWKVHIRELQQKLIDFGFDPSNSKPDKYFLKEKDNVIKILKKKLKIPNTQHIESLEFVALQEEREQVL